MEQMHNIAHHAHYFSIWYSIYLLITSFFINSFTILVIIFFSHCLYDRYFDSCFALCVVERILEDHDTLVENMVMWTRDTKNRILFEEREEKNDLFRRPEVTPLTPLTPCHVTHYNPCDQIFHKCVFCFRNTYDLHSLLSINSDWLF